MKGKICVITGANSGIGKVIARELAALEATVVMVCRSRERGEAALGEIIEKTGNRDVHLVVGDLSSLSDIRRFAAGLGKAYPKIDLLVNNAGAINDSRTETADGYETTFAVNHLGYFLLTDILLKNLKNAGKARIVNVASEASRTGSFHFDDLNLKKGYTPWKAYCQSKLANIAFTYELAERLRGTGVTANCMHPGGVHTNFGRGLTGFMGGVMTLFGRFMRTPEKGADTAVWLATSPLLEGTSGKYFHDRKEIRSKAVTYDKEVRRKLWEISEAMTGMSA